MRTNPSWKDYFVFSKRDKRVVVPVVFLFVVFGAFILFYNPKPEAPVIQNLDEELAKLSLPEEDSNGSFHSAATPDNESLASSAMLFYFDPNTAAEADWERLGVRSKVIHTILNYRNKGGHFYKPDDLRKIYGLSEEEADRLVPYVKIKTSAETSGSFTNASKTDRYSFLTKQKPQIIDINSATIEQWKALPAIGDALSARIVKYRDKLGGFTSINQVKQTYGLSDSAFEVILPYLRLTSTNVATIRRNSSPQKININKADAGELKNNPAISSDIAEAIVVYRSKHGKYSSVEDIKKIIFINEDIYQKIAPFLTTD